MSALTGQGTQGTQGTGQGTQGTGTVLVDANAENNDNSFTKFSFSPEGTNGGKVIGPFTAEENKNIKEYTIVINGIIEKEANNVTFKPKNSSIVLFNVDDNGGTSAQKKITVVNDNNTGKWGTKEIYNFVNCEGDCKELFHDMNLEEKSYGGARRTPRRRYRRRGSRRHRISREADGKN